MNSSDRGILIVDDVEQIRNRIRSILECEGYSVIGEACDGDDAVEMCGALLPGLVIMDVFMDRMDGIEATKKIKKLHPGINIVIMTQAAKPSVVVDCMRAGASNFIMKPFGDEALLRLVRSSIH